MEFHIKYTSINVTFLLKNSSDVAENWPLEDTLHAECATGPQFYVSHKSVLLRVYFRIETTDT